MTTRHLDVAINLTHVNLAVARSVDDHGCQVPLTGSGFQRTRVNSVLAIISFFKSHVAPCSRSIFAALGHAVRALANTVRGM